MDTGTGSAMHKLVLLTKLLSFYNYFSFIFYLLQWPTKYELVIIIIIIIIIIAF